MADKKEKKYLIDNPTLMTEWNYEKNNELGLDPKSLSFGSEKKAWWKCSKGHEWQTEIRHRTHGSGCPYCSGRYAIKGKNDLVTLKPELAREWNYEKNGDLKPEHFMPNSNKKVWWKCEKGHEWQAIIQSRNNGNGCPYCSGRLADNGVNDLLTKNPNLAKEWNYEKNGNLRPEHFMANSGKKVWWKCEKGHEWQATINSRSIGRGCPICNSERNTSFPEYAFIYYLKKHGVKSIHSYKEKGYELDIYIPSKKIAIEYDGYFWHKNKTKKDLDKNLNCKKDGIKLYRIRESLPSLNDTSIDYIVDKNQKDLDNIIEKVLCEIVGFTIDIDIGRDAIEIENLREHIEKENSLLYTNPKLAKEWNYEKNGNLRPEYVLANSGKKVWWKCSKGHEWQASIYSRNNGVGCPICSGKKVLVGYNDLATINPTLIKEWNYEKNGELKPEDFTTGSNKKVWWMCKKGHEWQATITDRNNGIGCPICSGRKVLVGYNDLKTINPNLAKEWNYEKNGNLRPEDFTTSSGKKVWWKCSKEHEWQATINHRNHGRDCPICANKKVVPGYNDLETLNPKLASEWNYEKNSNIKPRDVAVNSNIKVWWKCAKGHEWQATIAHRNIGTGCPVCVGKKVLSGYNDLKTINPKLASEWNYEKNNELKPQDFTPNSNKKVWWKCSNGHEWQAVINNRNKGSGCPYCYTLNRRK